MFPRFSASIKTLGIRTWYADFARKSLGIVLFSLTSSASCFGQTFWTDGTGNWNTAGNWSLGVPSSASGTAFDAVIENGGTAQLLGPPSGSVRRMRVGRAAGAGNVLVDAATLTVTQDLFLNENGTATSSMTVRNGSTVSAPTTFIGQSSAAVTNFAISGAGTTYTANSAFNVGNAGAGTASLTVDTGAVLNSFGGIIGNGSGTNGVATVRNPGSNWSTTGAMTVGSLGTGTLNIQDQGLVYVGSSLSINGTSAVNLNGGTLRVNTVSTGLNRLNYTAGTIQLAGDRDFRSDPLIPALFGTNPTIPGGKGLIVEGQSLLDGKTLAVNGGTFVSQGTLNIAADINANEGFLQVTNGGKVTANVAAQIDDASATISDPGSNWTIGGDLLIGPGTSIGDLTISNQGTVYISGSLLLGTQFSGTRLDVNGGTIRFNGYARIAGAFVTYSAGTIQLAGDRTMGGDFAVTEFFGASPVIPAGKSLVVEGTATIASAVPVTMNGGNLTAATLFISPGARLTNSAPSIVTGAVIASAGSVIDATAADLSIGDSTKVNGFYSDGTIKVGSHVVILADSNDAVFDSGALVTIGSGASPGTLSAGNGLSLNLGGNITGYGAVNTPNNIAKPLINNGHITGNSAGQPITLPGYVKGVGTFDNVNFTGTFSPGLSPTILTVGNVGLSPSSTLIMELGGMSPGSGYDQIQSSGALAFGGILQVLLINGFAPANGQSFNLFDWVTTNGTFTTLQLPTLSSGLMWNTSQLYTSGVLSVAPVGVPGDYNNNGVVDAADSIVWRKNQGTSNLLPNDPTGGTIGTAQYNTWRAHFGQTGGSGLGAIANAAVPEPATLVLVAFAASICVKRRRTIACAHNSSRMTHTKNPRLDTASLCEG